jgi:signal transduction histidine kinase
MVEFMRALADRSPMAIVATEGPAHVVRYVNPAFCGLTGRTTEVLLGSSLSAPGPATPSVQTEAALVVLARVYATGTSELDVDLAHAFGVAAAGPMACAVWPILDDDNRPAGLLVQVSAPVIPLPAPPAGLAGGDSDELRDVNRRLLVAGLEAQEQAELQLILRGEAEAALNVRDEFISIAAHELRTPVTGIKTSAQLALRTLDDTAPDKARTTRYLLGIVGGANHMVLLINDLMDVSRMRSGELLLRVVPLDLVALVSSLSLRYAETVGEQHQVTTDLPAAKLMVTGDAGRLEQILDNLMSNAVKYSPGGGEIKVRLRRATDGVVLTVIDGGIGLTPGAQERIFEPFGRAPNASRQGLPGMGLGLHICRQIAEAHGGRMWAESDGEGLGMAVGMWLPLSE